MKKGIKRKRTNANEYTFATFPAQSVISKNATNFSSLLGGFPSDHTQQSLKVNLVDTHGKVEACLTGITWNLLNICYSSMSLMGLKNGFNNNPLNIDETFEDYYARKMVQLDMLLDTIKSGKTDFIFLQEAKLFSEPSFTEVVVKFKRDLQRLGWAIDVTDDNDAKHLVTLYNRKILKPVKECFKSKHFKTENRGKYSGVELNFTYRNADIPVALTNIHLYETNDYSVDILDYQLRQIEKGIFTIIGGDTNHPLGFQQIGLIGNPAYATCLLSEYKVNECEKESTCSTEVELRTNETKDGQSFIARYDGFFANPASQSTKIVATEQPGLFFQYTESKVNTLQVLTLDPAKDYPGVDAHESKYGLPFVANDYQDRLSGSLEKISSEDDKVCLVAKSNSLN